MWIIDNPNGKDFAYFQGCDPGVSFISEYNPNNGIISVLVSNYGDNRKYICSIVICINTINIIVGTF